MMKPILNDMKKIITIAKQAGKAIMQIYQKDFKVEVKEDRSPLTEADLASHHLICDKLSKLYPDIPILSEESAENFTLANENTCYWCVDPLDGTKEFIKRNGEFTVNIALVEHGVPVLGVVFVPVLDVLYAGCRQSGAWKEVQGKRAAITTSTISPDQQTLKVVASRSHRGEVLDKWLQNAEKRFPGLELVSMGSSLKICLVAEGAADIYPRLALTSEWDTAAAQAVLEAAGGVLVDTGFNEYRYNTKENILNPFFFAIGDPAFKYQDL